MGAGWGWWVQWTMVSVGGREDGGRVARTCGVMGLVVVVVARDVRGRGWHRWASTSGVGQAGQSVSLREWPRVRGVPWVDWSEEEEVRKITYKGNDIRQHPKICSHESLKRTQVII